ncbi:MAG: HIT family protein [Alloprevotella sp.]|nr:HIT family protein [Alloprevotella sp.]MBR1595001.1 HIT family protein [Alloprevotella sp.]
MTIFSKIVAGEIPSYKCAENEEFYAFLDINPVTQGHALVIPKREVDYFFDLSDEELGRMMAFTKRVAAAIKAVFPCKKVGVAVMGLDVPHAHVHLAPLQSEVDMDFGKKKLSLAPDEMMQIASRILQAFEQQ